MRFVNTIFLNVTVGFDLRVRFGCCIWSAKLRHKKKMKLVSCPSDKCRLLLSRIIKMQVVPGLVDL